MKATQFCPAMSSCSGHYFAMKTFKVQFYTTGRFNRQTESIRAVHFYPTVSFLDLLFRHISPCLLSCKVLNLDKTYQDLKLSGNSTFSVLTFYRAPNFCFFFFVFLFIDVAMLVKVYPRIKFLITFGNNFLP